jgi:hypothetical protein
VQKLFMYTALGLLVNRLIHNEMNMQRWEGGGVVKLSCRNALYRGCPLSAGVHFHDLGNLTSVL